MSKSEKDQIYELTLWGMGRYATHREDSNIIENLIWRLGEIRKLTGVVK